MKERSKIIYYGVGFFTILAFGGVMFFHTPLAFLAALPAIGFKNI